MTSDIPAVASSSMSSSSLAEKVTDMSMMFLHKLPVVVILGATGTGKSKLAVQLAKKFGGEVISADSMQVYKSLDILTNKMTSEEMQSVPHHMISIVKPCEHFDVTCFRNQALPILENILSRKKIPFIVGGTNYYIESLLWKVLIQKPELLESTKSMSEDESISLTTTSRKRKMFDSAGDPESESKETSWDNEILSYFASRNGEYKKDELTHWTPQEFHAALREVDQERAVRLHPNDIRKILRSLQIRFRTGRKHSEFINEQNLNSSSSGNGGNSSSAGARNHDEHETTDKSLHLGGPLRFPNSLCLWIRTPKEILDPKIEARVDEMVTKGLREELNSYFEELLGAKRNLDFTRGLLQSIGFKEFRTYMQQVSQDRDTDQGEKLFAEGLLELKLVTKRYANKQLKWIKQRFLCPSRRQLPPVYGLDCSTLEATDWEEMRAISERILHAHLTSPDCEGEAPILSERRVPTSLKGDDDLVLRTCQVCDGRNFMGKIQWDIHMNSRKHSLMVKRSAPVEAKSLVEKEVTRATS